MKHGFTNYFLVILAFTLLWLLPFATLDSLRIDIPNWAGRPFELVLGPPSLFVWPVIEPILDPLPSCVASSAVLWWVVVGLLFILYFYLLFLPSFLYRRYGEPRVLVIQAVFLVAHLAAALYEMSGATGPHEPICF